MWGFAKFVKSGWSDLNGLLQFTVYPFESWQLQVSEILTHFDRLCVPSIKSSSKNICIQNLSIKVEQVVYKIRFRGTFIGRNSICKAEVC